MKTSLGKLVVVLLLLLVSFTCYGQQTLTVPDDYPTIQAAIDAAQAGDTVYIKAGRYIENLTITKPLHIVGEDRTKVIIQSPDEKNDVITVKLTQGNVQIEGIKVTSGQVGIVVKVAAGTQVKIANVISYKNQAGILAVGSGVLYLTQSYLIDSETVGLALWTSDSRVWGNEVLLGWTSVVLAETSNVTLNDNLIGLCKWGIATYTKNCGWDNGEERFTGNVAGEGNRIYGMKNDLCPEYPGSLWPDDFIDQAWKDGVTKAVDAFNWGIDLDNKQDYQGALNAYAAVLSLLKSAPFPLLEAYSNQNVGGVYAKLGRYEDALNLFQLARTVFTSHGMDVAVAEIDTNIGNVHGDLGRYEDALVAYRSARAVFAVHGLEVKVAVVDQNIGVVYDFLGRYQGALAKYESARAVFVSHGMDTKVAEIDANVGTVYKELGQYENALAKYKLARTVFATCRMDVNVAKIDQDIGAVYTGLGRYVDALEAYQSARAAYAAHGMEVDAAEIDTNIGNVYAYLGRYEDALTSFQDALSILDQTPPTTGMKYSYPASRWMIYNNLGLAHESLKEWDKARKSYEASIAVVESLRGYMKSEELKTAWQERTQYVYERLIKLLIDQGQGVSAFPYAERCRARTFLDALYQGSISPDHLISPEAGISSGAVDPLAIDQAVADARDSLQPNEAVLEYMVTDSGVYLWVITKETISDPIFIKYERAQLMNDVITLRKTLESDTPDPIVLTELFTSFYDKLVKESLAKLPDGVDTLILIPSGPLWYLPFSALIMTDQAGVPSGGLGTRSPYLVENYTLAYLPSLASLSSLTKGETEAAGGVRLLALADPELSPDQLRKGEGSKCGEEEPLGRYEQLVTACQDFAKHLVGEEQEEQCVYAGREAQEVRAHEDTGRQVVVYAAHGQFNPYVPLQSKLLLAPGGEAANLQSDSRKPDGNYHAWEALLTDYRGTELVILAACETLLPHLSNLKGTLAVLAKQECDQVELTPQQLEQIVVGDEVVGLARAFLSSGAEAVLGTLWLANPTAIGELLTSMAEYRKNEGNTWVQALTKAQRDLIKGTTFSNPWFWAPYQLIGRWR